MPDGLTPVTITQQKFSTRTLLHCAVFAGLQAVLYIAVSPFIASLATIFPPAYAVAAGAYSLMVFAARLFINRHGTAALTAAFTGVLIAAISPIGLIVVVPLVASGAALDLVLFWTRRANRHRVLRSVLPAALSSAVTLFVISLPAFSSGHLAPWVLAATLLGRAVGQVSAVLLATSVVAALSRSGIRAAGASRGSDASAP